MLLFVHVLLHPLVHVIGPSGAASDLARVTASSTQSDSSLATAINASFAALDITPLSLPNCRKLIY